MTKLFIVINVDWFFLSHRLPIALAAKENNYDVTIVTANTGKLDLIKEYGLKVIEIPFSRTGTNIFREWEILKQLIKVYNFHKPNIVHHVTLKPSIYGSIAARKAGIKKVVNAISGLGYNFANGRAGLRQQFLYCLIKRSFKDQQLHFIFQNNDDVEIFKSRAFISSKHNVHIIKGSGVDLNYFSFFNEKKSDFLQVILPARMILDKGIVAFIEAAKILKSEYEDNVKFILAGNIDIENPAALGENELIELTDPPYLTWIGYQANIRDLLVDSHVVVLPSYYREGVPKSLIEACAIGRPIVTTDMPGCRECVIEGYNGFLIPIKDPVRLAAVVKKLLDSKGLRKTMGCNSRRLAEQKFSIEDVISKTLNIYKSFASNEKVLP